MTSSDHPAASLYAHHATVLRVHDLPRSRAFYRDGLGFSVEFEWEDPPSYAVLRAGETALHLSLQDPPPDGSEPPRLRPAIVYLFVHDVDALHARLEAAGVEIAIPLQTHDYGMREFEVHDPDGHKLVFGQGVGAE